MPRVYTYKTATRRKTTDKYRCVKCGKDIEVGQKRYEWSFRYGGTYRQHVTCGYPTRGQLTQSKMGQVYDAIDSVSWSDTQAGIITDLESIRDTVDEVKSEYEEAAEHFGGVGQNRDTADELESFVSSLESAISEIEGEDKAEDESEEDFVQRLQDIAQTAVDECP